MGELDSWSYNPRSSSFFGRTIFFFAELVLQLTKEHIDNLLKPSLMERKKRPTAYQKSWAEK